MKKKLLYPETTLAARAARLRHLLVVFVCLLQLGTVVAQSGKAVTGVVKDDKGSAIAGATVVVAGTTRGVVTSTDGRYSIVAEPGETLVAGFVGYVSQTAQVGASRTVDFVMKEDVTAIGEVVVTALGIARESKSLSYDVQQITAGEVARTRDVNLMGSLAGKVAGVSINTSAAGIGGGSRVVMRGTKSINGNNNALYVVDGIPMPNLSAGQPDDKYTGAGQSGDGMANFNPDDIESISILSGSAAAALYGSEAANGVVIINTRKGTPGKVRLSYSNSTTFYTALMLPDFQNTYGSETGEWFSWASKMGAPTNYDPADFFQTGYSIANTVSLSTGGEKNQTYISAGVVNSRGIIQNNEMDRYNISVRNTSTLLKDKMTLDVSFIYSKTGEQNMLAQGEYANPLVPVYLFPRGDDINKYMYYERYNTGRNIKTQFWPLSDNGLSMQNPWWITNRNMYLNDKDRFLASVAAKYKINDWLSISGRVKLDQNITTSERKMYASTLTVLSENSNKGSYIKRDYNTRQTYADIMLNASKYFGSDKEYNLTAAVGASIKDVIYKEYAFGGGLKTIPNMFTYGNIDTDGKLTYTQNNHHDRTNALFATASLGYRSMLYIDGTLRNDWLSALAGTGQQSILYPSAGVSAILSDLFKVKSKVLSYAKLRISYAEVGNAPERFKAISTWPVQGNLTTTSYFPVTDLKPERTHSWEAGLNMNFFDNRLSFNATVYKSYTENQLFNPIISSTLGYTSIYVNGGKVSNKGIELSAGFKQNLGPVNWNTNLIWSLNRNRVDRLLPEYTNAELDLTVSLNELDVYSLGGAKQMLTVGGSMGDIYVNTMRTDANGYIWINSMTGALETEKNNWMYAGNSAPDYTLGWRNSFDWNGLQFGFLVNARVGGVGVSATQAVLDYYGVSQKSAAARDNGGVVINDGYKIDAQQWYQTIGANGTNFVGSMYTYSMTNVRLGEVTVGYNLPVGKWCKWIQSANVSLVGRNLLMFYCKAPFDPESTASTGTYNQGMDYFMQPSLRSMGFSASITF